MSDYIFNEHHVDSELARLRLIEELFDPTTRRHLASTGVSAGWKCLELGVGAGSILNWLGDTVTESGCVVGVDQKADYVRELTQQPFRIAEGDFAELSLDQDFDLAHCRYVLIHNQGGDGLLQKLADSLRPGGVLVVEEPDFSSPTLLNRHACDSQSRVYQAVCRLFQERGCEADYGLRLPQRVGAVGLRVTTVDSRLHLANGGSTMARMMAASTTALADKYVTTGEASQQDIEQYLRNAEDEQFWTIYYSTTSVIAAKLE